MARTLLDKELQELDAQIIRLGSLVDDALAKALEALESGDLAISGLVIEADAVIDSLRAAIEEHTIRLLTNHPRKVVGLDAYGIEIVEQVPV